MEQAELWRVVMAEIERLGPKGKPPGFAAYPASLESLLAHLRALPPGATWADLLRRLDPAWDPNAPVPYRPLGSWDHQAPPEEPAFHLLHATAPDGWITSLVAAASAAGVPLHGGGRLEQPSGARLGPEHGWVTVQRGLSEEQVADVWGWLEAQPGVEVASRPR